MTEGPAIDKSVKFKDSEDYFGSSWGKILRPDQRDGVSGWVLSVDVYDDDGYPTDQTIERFVSEADILWVEEFPSVGTGHFVIHGQVGEPKISNEKFEDISVTSVEFERGPERLGEVCVQADPQDLKDLAYFLLEQSRILEAMEPYERDGYHAHYRSDNCYPDFIVAGLFPPNA